MHAQVHNIAQSNPAYAGLLGWAGIDYASLNGGNRIWHNMKWPGVIDTFRVPKPGAAFYRSQVDPTVRPVILPVFFWDFGAGTPNGPGSNAMFSTNCDRLEIHVGSQHVTGTPDTADYASLAHPPVFVDLSSVESANLPDLRVDGYVGTELLATLQMSSDPLKDRLVLTIEDPIINGDGTDATRFTFRALDAYGNQRPHYREQRYGHADPDRPGHARRRQPVPVRNLRRDRRRLHPLPAGRVRLGDVDRHPSDAWSGDRPAHRPARARAHPERRNPRDASAPGDHAGIPPPPPAAPPQSPPSTRRRTPRTACRRNRSARRWPPSSSPTARTGGSASSCGTPATPFGFDAPEPGRLVIAWYHTEARRRLVVAHAALTLHRAGPVTVKIRLTGPGRSLLRHAHHLRLTAQASFTPAAGKTVRAARRIMIAR